MGKSGLAQVPGDHQSPAIEAIIHGSVFLHGMQLLIGLTASVLGGYIAAWIAKHDELLNGLLSSWLCTAIGIYSLAAKHQSVSWFEHVILFILSPVFALLGGYLRYFWKSRRGPSGPRLNPQATA